MKQSDLAVMRKEHSDLLEEEFPRIVGELKALGATRILLFGSYAAGRRDLFTDLDIIAIMDSSLPFLERMSDVRRQVRPRVETDLLVYTPEEFEEIKDRPFFRHALKTGKVVHESR